MRNDIMNDRFSTKPTGSTRGSVLPNLNVRYVYDPHADKKSKKLKGPRGVPGSSGSPAVDAAAERQAKDWLVTDPQGQEYKIHNLAKFCRERDLNPHCMSAIAKGNAKHHKGWKCCAAEVKE